MFGKQVEIRIVPTKVISQYRTFDYFQVLEGHATY